MRRLIASAALLAALPAAAADMSGPPPVLRGVLPVVDRGIDWAGFYFGGSASYNSLALNRNRSVANVDPLLQRLVAGTVVASGVFAMPLVETGRFNSSKIGIGGFVGYNIVADEAVFGLEVGYTRAKFMNDITGQRSGRVPVAGPPDMTYDWTAQTQKRSKLTDVATVSGRLGYAWGHLLPYVTAGVAIGRSAEQRSASISGVQWLTAEGASCAAAPSCAPTLYNPSSLTEGNRAKFQFGYALGAGVDVALTSNIFLRAAVQHIRFPDLAGTTAQLNQAKLGAGVKF